MDPYQPNYLSPIVSFLSKKRLESSTQESKNVQVSEQIEIPYSEDLIVEQYQYKDIIFLKACSEA